MRKNMKLYENVVFCVFAIFLKASQHRENVFLIFSKHAFTGKEWIQKHETYGNFHIFSSPLLRKTVIFPKMKTVNIQMLPAKTLEIWRFDTRTT